MFPLRKHVACNARLLCAISVHWLTIFVCLKGNYRPDMIIITEGLLMFYGEEKPENMEGQALDDAARKFRYGLSPLFYGSIPYLPLYIATGNLVQFHLLLADGSVSSHMLLAALATTCMHA